MQSSHTLLAPLPPLLDVQMMVRPLMLRQMILPREPICPLPRTVRDLALKKLHFLLPMHAALMPLQISQPRKRRLGRTTWPAARIAALLPGRARDGWRQAAEIDIGRLGFLVLLLDRRSRTGRGCGIRHAASVADGVGFG